MECRVLLMEPRPPRATLFPYTTLFRSREDVRERVAGGIRRRGVVVRELIARGDDEEDPARSVRLDGVEQGLRSEEHTSELQSLTNLVCRLLLAKKALLFRPGMQRLRLR